MRVINLNPIESGKYAIVDDSDYELVCNHVWRFGGRTGYAETSIHSGNTCRTIRMHQLILRAQKGMVTDHINRNKLDNRRTNLRVASFSENARNRGVNKNSKSGIKGVFLDKRYNQWRCQVTIDHKSKPVGGRFDSPLEAAKCRDFYAKMLHGEFFSPSLPQDK